MKELNICIASGTFSKGLLKLFDLNGGFQFLHYTVVHCPFIVFIIVINIRIGVKELTFIEGWNIN